MNPLRTEIKELIVRTLALEGVAPADIADEAPLFGDGLGLDSIDAIELGVAVRKRYGISVSAESDPRRHFASVASLADFVAANRTDTP
jgi:acyl carrier protein